MMTFLINTGLHWDSNPKNTVDEEIVTCRALNASDLVEANEKGRN